MSIKGYIFSRQLFSYAMLVVAGGIIFSSCQNVSTSSTDIGDWALASQYSGSPRTQASSFIIGNTVYIGGGYNGVTNVRLSDWWKFDETNGTWYKIASFPGTARNLAVGFAVDGKGYVATGYDGTNFLSDYWSYDPTADIWDSLGDISVQTNGDFTPRYGAVGFGVGDTGYLATGYDVNLSWQKDLWKFSPATGTWSKGTDLGGGVIGGIGGDIGNDKREGAVAFVYTNSSNGTQTPFVITGTNNGSYVDDVLSYNVSSGLWTAHRKINDTNDSSYDAAYGTNILRSDASVFLINDTAYLTCGSYNGVLGTTWAYDIGNDQWFQKTSFEGSTREGAIGFNINNHGYITTGSNGSTYYDDTWQFFPDAAQTNNDNY